MSPLPHVVKHPDRLWPVTKNVSSVMGDAAEMPIHDFKQWQEGHQACSYIVRAKELGDWDALGYASDVVVNEITHDK